MNEDRSRRVRSLPLRALLLTALGAVWLAGACGSGGGDEEPRRAALVDLASHVIVPTYRDLSIAAEELVTAATAFEVAPSAEKLDALRDAWRAARSRWKRSEAFRFGPAEDLRTDAKIDWAPIRSSRIESAIAAEAAFDSAYVEDLGANQKGFLALEYLLFDPLDEDAKALDALTGAGGQRRREFARALCENLADEAFRLYDAWRPEGGNFELEFDEAGRGSTVYETLKDALDELVNQMIFLSEDIADAQLLAAVGREGEPDPAAIESRVSGGGRRDALDNLISIQNAYLSMYPGQAPHSLGRLVRSQNAAAEVAIRDSIVHSIELVAAIPDPLRDAVESDRDAVWAAQAQTREVERRLEIDLISILGGTLRFNPGDGD